MFDTCTCLALFLFFFLRNRSLPIDWEATLIIQAKEGMEIGFEVQSRIGVELSRVPRQTVLDSVRKQLLCHHNLNWIAFSSALIFNGNRMLKHAESVFWLNDK